MTNDIVNNDTLVIHGLSGLVLKCQLRMNSEKLKKRISITQFLNVLYLQYVLLNIYSAGYNSHQISDKQVVLQ